MAEEKPIRVEDAHYVNEATLELLQRRIESVIKTNVLRWLGIPAGTSLLAIAIGLYVYVPNMISGFVEKDPAVQRQLQDVTVEYLKDPKRGQRFIQGELEKITPGLLEAAVAEQVNAAVKTYFADPRGGQRVVTMQVNSAVESYFTRPDAGRQFIQGLVTSYLTSADGKKAIQDQVKRELEPRVASLLEPVRKNAAQLVVQAENLQVLSVVRKDTLEALEDVLRRRAAEMKRASKDIALTKQIRQGPRHYEPFVIDAYLDRLQREFGQKFRHVVFVDRDGTFVARIDPKLFRTGLQQQQDRILRILNAEEGSLSREAAQVELDRIFGRPVSTAIPHEWTVERALRAPVWGRPPDPLREVAVLGEQGGFIGTTTRDRLLATILGNTPGGV